jgi:hypothetical protein
LVLTSFNFKQKPLAMKYFFIMLIMLAFAATVSAQHYNDYGRRRGRVTFGVTIGTPAPYTVYNGGGYYSDGRVAEINREFEHRIWEVRNDWRLSPWEKRRMINDLNYRREERIRQVMRYGSYDRRWNY